MSTRPKTAAEYDGLVDQAIDELQDIIEAADFDFDEVESNLGYVNHLLKEMRALRTTMTDGTYQFGRKDLPWMRIIKQHSEQDLPCIRLFYVINQTHREGLDIDSA
jgi:predicted DNA-binding ArsR family transcriptional regulator